MAHSQLHIHAHAGREAGVMIIGTRDERAEVAIDLQRSLSVEATNATPGWPYRVLVVNGVSPFVDKECPISFHVRTRPIPTSLQKTICHAPSTPVFLAIALLALVGLVSVPVWLSKAF